MNNQIEEMAKHGCYDGCASGLRKFCDEYDGKPCKNMVRIANGLYEQGYRKISQGSVVLTKVEKQKLLKEMYEQGRFDAIADLDKEGKVVLTREEKEEYESLIKLLIYDKPMKNRVYEVIKDIKQQTRKETTEKILNELLDFVNGWFEDVEDNDFGVEFNRISKDLAEKYGVKIKE